MDIMKNQVMNFFVDCPGFLSTDCEYRLPFSKGMGYPKHLQMHMQRIRQ